METANEKQRVTTAQRNHHIDAARVLVIGMTRVMASFALVMFAVLFAQAKGENGWVCGEDGTVAHAVLESLEVSKLSASESGVRRCAPAFFVAACSARGASGFTQDSGSRTRTTNDDLSCFAPVCALACSNVGVKPRGGFWEVDRNFHAAEVLRTRRTLCLACATLPLDEVEETKQNGIENSQRVSPVDVWTTGWYASWLTFLAVDVIVAASLGYPGPPCGPGWNCGPGPYLPHNASDAPVVQPTIIDNVLVDPYWSPSVVLPEVVPVVTQEVSSTAYPWWPPPTAYTAVSTSPPAPPPYSSQNTETCSVDELSTALPSFASSLIPCLGGASASCCSAIVQAVGPQASAALPNCLCNANAFEALEEILNELSIELPALLQTCNANADDNSGVIGFNSENGKIGGSCDGLRMVKYGEVQEPATVSAIRRRTPGKQTANIRQ